LIKCQSIIQRLDSNDALASEIIDLDNDSDLESSRTVKSFEKDPKNYRLENRILRQRWRKSDDIELFKFLRDYCTQNDETIESLRDKLLVSSSDEVSRWETIADAMKWRGPVITLQKRYLKLCKRQSFSIRDEKLLNKLYMKVMDDSHIDWQEILDHFPGRKMKFLKEYCLKKKEMWKLTSSPNDQISLLSGNGSIA